MRNIFLYAVKIGLIVFLAAGAFADDLWDGEYYKNNSELQYRWAYKYIEKLSLSGTEKVLDIGSGDGRVTALIAKRVPKGQVVGIDSSPSMIRSANDFLKKSGFTHLAFRQQDASQINVGDDFDWVVSFNCLHWVNDIPATLRGVSRSLKAGGKTFLYFAPDHGHDRFDHAIDGVMKEAKWSPYFTNFTNSFHLITPTQLVVGFQEAGLLLGRVEVIQVDEIYDSKEAFAKWITGWMPHIKVLPSEKQQTFILEVIDRYLQKQPIDRNGKIHFVDYWLEAEAQKPRA